MKTCPCGSSERHTDCCRPYHLFELEPPTPSTLVRARFCAFCCKEPAFLWRTLHTRHPDKAGREEEFSRQIRAVASKLKYVRLRILDERILGEQAQVLFSAEIYESGKDRSFLECSDFEKEMGAWRYLEGETAKPPADSAGFTIDRFLAQHAG